MHGYQARGVTHLYEHDVCQSVLPMGSGKTVIGLTTIRELIDDGHIRCALVLAPKRVAQLVWPAEPPQWEHLAGMKVCVVAGDPTERAALLASNAEMIEQVRSLGLECYRCNTKEEIDRCLG